ncbi:hypothetical protein MN0502_26280 [Arthrobacter sp. MN05-02]|nr:hypothetical protein MN0502_26280 [Arthrobacter sp. MN05-02]
MDTLQQPGAQDLMREVGAGLVDRADGVPDGRRAAAESCHLWEDEPHPVPRLAAVPQFGEGLLVGAVGVLRVDESCEVVGVGHAGLRRKSGRAGTSSVANRTDKGAGGR